MRIALDATYSLGHNLSGVGVYSRELLHGLADAGPADDWEWFYRFRHYWKARPEPLSANVRRRLLAESLGSRGADLFHGLNQRLPRRRFRRQVATFHDLFVLSAEYSTPEFRVRFAEQARHAASTADLLIAVSAFTAAQMEQYLGVEPARIRVVHHGIAARPLPQAGRENVVLCVGAIQKRKNQATLVRAFRAMPPNWRLVLAGSGGFGAEETGRAIAESPARERIQVTGYVSDEEIARWYARARIFAFPSLDEGFGMPVLEAMAAGVPVVTSNCSALPEVAGDAALLANPAEEEDLAAALVRLSADQGLSAELIRRGRRRAAQFSWHRAVAQTRAVYDELLSSPTVIRSALRNRSS